MANKYNFPERLVECIHEICGKIRWIETFQNGEWFAGYRRSTLTPNGWVKSVPISGNGYAAWDYRYEDGIYPEHDREPDLVITR